MDISVQKTQFKTFEGNSIIYNITAAQKIFNAVKEFETIFFFQLEKKNWITLLSSLSFLKQANFFNCHFCKYTEMNQNKIIFTETLGLIEEKEHSHLLKKKLGLAEIK